MKWRKEVLLLPIKELNRNDFHECLTPISAYQFKVPGGDFVFPMKERFERIQAGFSSEAVERPVSQPLENQDAEPQEEPGELLPAPPVAPVADLTVKPPEVIDPKTGKVVPLPEGERYYDSGGVFGRRYGGTRGSKKPVRYPVPFGLICQRSRKRKLLTMKHESSHSKSSTKSSEGHRAAVRSLQPLHCPTKIAGRWMAISSRDFTLHHPAGSCSLLTLLIAPWLSARLPKPAIRLSSRSEAST